MPRYLRSIFLSLIALFFSKFAYSGSLELVKIESGKKQVSETLITLANESKKILKIGDKIQDGTEISTSAEHKITFLSSNGNRVQVAPNSRITLSSITGYGEEYELGTGKAWFQVLKHKLGFFNVRHKNFYAQVEGTEYSVAVTPDKDIRIAVDEGVVRTRRPVKVVIEEGHKEQNMELSEAVRAGEERVYSLDVDAFLIKYKTFKDADSYYRTNLKADRASKDPSRIAHGLQQMGWLLITLGRHQEAMPYFEEFLTLSRSRYPSGLHTDIADAYEGLGNATGQQLGEKNLKTALTYFEKSLSILRQVYRNDLNPKIAIALNDSGAAQFYLGGDRNIKAAMSNYLEALAIINRIDPSSTSKEAVLILNNLGTAVKNTEGEDALKNAVQYYEQSLESNGRLGERKQGYFYAITLTNLAIAFSSSDDRSQVQKALNYSDQALQEFDSIFAGKPHIDMLYALNVKARAFLKLGGDLNIKSAISTLHLAQGIAYQLDPKNKLLRTALVYETLGAAYMQLNGEENKLLAISSLETAANIERELYPSGDSLYLVSTLALLSNAYQGSSNVKTRAKAIQSCEEGLKINRNLRDANHPDVAAAYIMLGYAQLANGTNSLLLARNNIKTGVDILRNNPDESIKNSAEVMGSIESIIKISRVFGTPEDIRLAERYEAVLADLKRENSFFGKIFQ